MTDEALIGPNAIIQVADAIRREFGLDRLVQIMHAARLAQLADDRELADRLATAGARALAQAAAD